MIWRPPNYDPQDCGAKCDQCFLRVAGASRPVPAEWHVDDRGRFTDKIAVVGEAPGENEEAEMRPFVGDSGILITDALQRAGINRNQMLITNAVLCRPEKNDFSAMQRKLKKVNADRLKAGLVPLLDPLDACSERLRREISGFAHIIPAGNRAVQAVAGNVETITRLRGAMMDGWLIGTDDGPRYFPAEDVYATVAPNLGDTQHRAKLLPSLHPAFVLRSKRWMKAFYSDLMRAVAWFEGRIEYQEPTLVFKPSPAELRAFLATLHIGACDVETDALEPMLAKLRCIGFGNADTAYVVPRHSVDGQTIYYSDAEWAEIVTIIRDWLRDPNKVKVGHNFGYYDRMVIERYFNCIPITVIDTVLVHRLIEPELPHNLAYVVSMYTAISPAWKSTHTATTARSDLELGKYNGNDNVLDFRALGPMWAQLEARDQVSLLAHDAHSQAVCVEMHQVGMYVDQNRRLEHEYRYGLEGWMWRQRILDVVEKPGFNPQSVPQVREFMFQTLQLPIPDAIVPDKHGREKLKPMLTGSGDPSTSDDAIRALLVHPQVRRNKRAVAFLLALRRYRAAMKLLGTYIVKLRPQSEFADVGIDLEDVNDVVGDSLWDFDSNGFIDEYEVSARAKAERKRVKARKRGIVWPDGRIHPDYNAHGPVTGRKSSSNPNCFDGATEILTPMGWVRFDQLVDGTPVAQWHNGAIEFVTPTAYVRKPFCGNMIHAHNQHIDLFATPDHRCLLRGRKGQLKVFPASEYPEDMQQIHAGHYRGGIIGADSLTDAHIIFLCAVQADASWTAAGGLDTAFSKERKIVRFRQCLQDLKIPHTERVHPRDTGNVTRFIVQPKDVPWYVHDLLGPRKLFGPWILHLAYDRLRFFAEEVFHWDGCFTRQNHYSSNEKVNAEWIQIAHTLIGHRTHLRKYRHAQSTADNWQVDVTRKDFSYTTNRAHEEVPFDGTVYCVSVPSSYIVVRRNGHVIVTGQSQNFPAIIRDMIIAAAGHVLIGADQEQLELRILAALYGLEKYLEALDRGADPHATTALGAFPDSDAESAFRRVAGFPSGGFWDGDFFFNPNGGKWAGLAKMCRDLAKRIQYAGQYWATVETIFRVIQSAEDEMGNLIYPNLTLPQVRMRYDNWRGYVPEIERGWEGDLATYRRQGYLREPVLGRRRDFLDGENKNEIVNFRVQAAGAALILLIEERCRSQIPAFYAGEGTGQINNGHDALFFEVPENDADRVCAIVDEAFNIEHPALPRVKFTGKAEKGRTWKSVC